MRLWWLGVVLVTGCLLPVGEGVDAGGTCRTPLGTVPTDIVFAIYGLEPRNPGEHLGGRLFFGEMAPFDDVLLRSTSASPVLWPCAWSVGARWVVTSEAVFVHFSINPHSGPDRELLYRFTDDLQAEMTRACSADGGFGPALVSFPFAPAPPWHPAAIAPTPEGPLTCLAHADDAGTPIELQLLRGDGGVVSTIASKARSCAYLQPPLAIAGTWDGTQADLINFETQAVSRVPNVECVLAPEVGALCPVGATVVAASGTTSRELLREEGAEFFVMHPSMRGRHYVRKQSADGGIGFYLLRGETLAWVADGLPNATIGDWDDAGAYLVSARLFEDGGAAFEFERVCLP